MSYKPCKLRRHSQAFPGDDEQPVIELVEEAQPPHRQHRRTSGQRVRGAHRQAKGRAQGVRVVLPMYQAVHILLHYFSLNLVSEESLRAAEEKVSIAQTAYEMVDRQIKLLDQAIKEQEAAISLGMRPGTHLAPIPLPDIVEHSPLTLTPKPKPSSAPIVFNEAVPVIPPSVEKGKRLVSHESERKEEAAIPAEASKTQRGVKLTLCSSSRSEWWTTALP
ncbi:hypothetical protein SCLCIDRAFT_1158449 [Scleroderma citrinum Foug A]|uniref:Inhibitor of growth protein N-terminal histone-binding domain-containing protein n=1 Tax=Scleroderma citrinum Foug A TaxID=1036808 RepID=A0A0C2YU97_9AGAM|nr:hypothetical protein SCLCIDRAFT_1158449 [Scleroderma citrinum Foug A]